MWRRSILYQIVLLAVQLYHLSKGEMLDKTAEVLTNLETTFEACLKVGNNDGVLDSMDGILSAYYTDVFIPDFDGKVTKEQWDEILTSDQEKEIDLLSSYGVKEDVLKHLDAVYLQLSEFCQQKAEEMELNDVFLWSDPHGFNVDMVASFFRFWEVEGEGVDDANEIIPEDADSPQK